MQVLVITDTHERGQMLLRAFRLGRRAPKGTNVRVRSVGHPSAMNDLLGLQFDVAFVDPDAKFSLEVREAVWEFVYGKSAPGTMTERLK